LIPEEVAMSCGIPGHDHALDGAGDEPVWRCNLCGTEFEEGVADPGPDGAPRCPQCLMCDATRIVRSEYQSFVIRKTSRFR